MNKKKDKSKKRVVVVNANGQAHIKCSFNNIIISITNETGQVISWSSAGKMGFRGSRKILLLQLKLLQKMLLNLLMNLA